MFYVQVDKLGRILIPKAVRDRMALKPGSALVAGEVDGRLVLEKSELFTKAWADRVRKELKGYDWAKAEREVEAEANELAVKLYPDLAGHERDRLRREESRKSRRRGRTRKPDP
jgi:AbrB family looped-hinge helix DNA binding protein